jgi:hypothetical protein
LAEVNSYEFRHRYETMLDNFSFERRSPPSSYWNPRDELPPYIARVAAMATYLEGGDVKVEDYAWKEFMEKAFVRSLWLGSLRSIWIATWGRLAQVLARRGHECEAKLVLGEVLKEVLASMSGRHLSRSQSLPEGAFDEILEDEWPQSFSDWLDLIEKVMSSDKLPEKSYSEVASNKWGARKVARAVTLYEAIEGTISVDRSIVISPRDLQAFENKPSVCTSQRLKRIHRCLESARQSERLSMKRCIDGLEPILKALGLFEATQQHIEALGMPRISHPFSRGR